MNIAELVPTRHIRFNLQARTAEEARTELVDSLIEARALPSDLRSTILTALTDREKQLSTAIGQQIALPHASVQGLASAVGAVGRVAHDIPCGAADGRPVRLFFLILVPGDEYSAHLRTLAGVSRFLGRPGMRQRLIAAPDAAALEKLLHEEDPSVPADPS